MIQNHLMPKMSSREPATRSLIALACTVLALVAIGCESGAISERPNILLISIDTLRADHLGSYGYERSTSPALDRLAADGVLFESVIANSPWTLPSHASMLTGLYPRTHGLKDHRSGLREDISTLAEVLLEQGYQTMGLVNSHYLSERYGLHRGFQKFREYAPRVERQRVRCGSEQVDQAIAWLGEAADDPFFMFIHNYDVHSDYDPSPDFLGMFARPYDGNFQGSSGELKLIRSGDMALTEADVQHMLDRYDGGIRQLESDLSRLFDYIEQSDLAANTVVIVTSDHGEEFLEHGGVLHGRTMYAEALDIPLILRGPGLPAGRRIEGLVQLTDVFPTVLEMAGVRGIEVDGVSLTSAWNGVPLPPQRLVYAEADHNNVEDDIKKMVRIGAAKLIYDRLSDEYELFDLGKDPGELENIAALDPETVKVLMAHLERYAAGDREAIDLSPLSEEEIENLKALGYL